MTTIIYHLDDGEKRAVCNSYMAVNPEEVLNWGDNTINCKSCLTMVYKANTKLAMLQSVARDLSNIQKKLSAKTEAQEYEDLDFLIRTKKRMEAEERVYHPRSANEAYLMAVLVSEQEMRKNKNQKILDKRG